VKRSEQKCGPVPKKVIKDAIHEYVELPADFVETAVDRRIFQRLRWIAQLSMNLHVYPGATHTRFEHSLGVAYVMMRALNALRANTRLHVLQSLEAERRRLEGTPEEEVIGRVVWLVERTVEKLEEMEKEAVLAALYHDIGHIMLSHAAESGIRDILLRSPPYAPKGYPAYDIDHEALTLKIVRSLLEAWRRGRSRSSLQGAEGAGPYNIYYGCEEVDLELAYKILGAAYDSQERARYCRPVRLTPGRGGRGLDAYLEGGLEEAAGSLAVCMAASLLSSNIDVDRADYILRDSRHTGSKAGIYDIDRYYSVLTIVPRLEKLSKDEYEVTFRLGVLEKGVAIVENMLLSRVYLYRDLYLHDISMIYGSMAARLLALLLYASRLLAANPGPRAREALDRFPLLDALSRYSRVIDEFDDFARLESYLDRLTDHEFYALARRLSSPDYKLFVEAFREAAGAEGLPGEMVDEAVLAVGILAKGVTERKHWTGLILTGDPATRAISMIRGEEEILAEIRRYISPLVMLDYSTYVAYKRDRPGRDGKGIYVFYRSHPLEPTEITRSPYSTIVDKIADIAYSKILVSFPPDPLDGKPGTPKPRLWIVRRGKPRPTTCRHPCTGRSRQVSPGPREFVEPVAHMAGLKWERAREMIREAADRAWSLARLIESRVSGG